MTTSRRDILRSAGLLAAVVPLQSALAADTPRPAVASGAFEFKNWASLRNEFDLDYSWRNFAGFLLASHPRIVAQDIEYHRMQLNRNPANYLLEAWGLQEEARKWAGKYFGVAPEQIGLTENTTMGLATLYNGISIKPGQEVLTTEHEHYSSHTSLHAVYAIENSIVIVAPLVEFFDKFPNFVNG